MRKVQSTHCAGATEGGDVVSVDLTCVGSDTQDATACAAGGVIREWPVGTEGCETATGLPETLQQVEFSGCACTFGAGVAVLRAIIGQPEAQTWEAPALLVNKQRDIAAAGQARRPISTSVATSLERRFTTSTNANPSIAAPGRCDPCHIQT